MQQQRQKMRQSRLDQYGEALSARGRARVYLLMMALGIGFLVLTLRLVQLHCFPNPLTSKYDAYHIGKVTLKEPRGEIYDRNGRLLATERKTAALWANPRKIAPEQLEESIAVLSSRLALPRQKIRESLTRRNAAGNLLEFVYLKRWLSHEEETALADLVEAYPGLSFVKEPVRFYPGNDSASHVLGFVNREGVASEGIEMAFNQYLHSEPGLYRTRKDVKRKLLASAALEWEEPRGGDDLYLTLDLGIQQFLETTLDQRIEDVEAKSGMGIVMDPHTGAILALACRPAFDPNRFNEYSGNTAALRKNRALLDQFEPGSVFKLITASGALEYGLVTPDTMFDTEGGAYNPYGKTIHDTHEYDVSAIPFWQAYQDSSNIIMVKAAALMGEERFDIWSRQFGFGQRVTSDFTFEAKGVFRPRSQWSGWSMSSLPFGQEISVTMVQLARAYAVVANGGYLVEPYVVEQAVSYDDYITYQHDRSNRKQIMSAEVAATMREFCHLVVSEHGTGRRAIIKEYKAGGKTGTAQIAERGGYSKTRYTSVFVGFAPVDAPRVVCAIVIFEPNYAKRWHYGGYACGPVFRDVVRHSLISMNVPQDYSPEENPELLLAELDPESLRDDAPQDGVEAPLKAPTNVLELAAASGDESEASGPTLPDFTGLTKRQAGEQIRALGLTWDPTGAGWVVGQNPPAGTPLSKVSLCSLNFALKKTTSDTNEHDATENTL